MPPTGPAPLERGPAGGAGGSTVVTHLSTADLPAAPDVALSVFNDLLRLEQRPSRIDELLAEWSERFSSSVRRGDHDVAEQWIRAVVDRDEWSDDVRPIIEAALDGITRRELVEQVVVDLAHDESSNAGAGLLAAWGGRLVPYLLEWIVADEAPVSRKHVIDQLAAVAKRDVASVSTHLDDPRWFVVRNFATVVGRSGHREAAVDLERVLGHSDDRVRVEAVRGIAALRKEAALPTIIDALEDPSERVRQAAASLLRSIPSDDVVAMAEEAVVERRVEPADAVRLVRLIAERSDTVAVPALRRIAARRGFRGVAKAAREAAVEELEGRTA